MASSGMLRRVVLVRTDVSEELSASLIRVTRIGELGTTLAVTSKKYHLVFFRSVRRCVHIHHLSSSAGTVGQCVAPVIVNSVRLQPYK
jgi:hypothetical protein